MKRIYSYIPVTLVFIITVTMLLGVAKPTAQAQEVEVSWGEWEVTRGETDQWKGFQQEVDLAKFEVQEGQAVEFFTEQKQIRDEKHPQRNEEASIRDNGTEIHRFTDGVIEDGRTQSFSRIFTSGAHDLKSIWDGGWCEGSDLECNGSYTIKAMIRVGKIIQITPTSTITTTPVITPTGTQTPGVTLTPPPPVEASKTPTPTATPEIIPLKQGALILNLDWQGEGVGPQEPGTLWCNAEGIRNKDGEDAHNDEIPHWVITLSDVTSNKQWWTKPVPFWLYRDALEFYCYFESVSGTYDLVIGNYTRVDPVSGRSYIGVGPITTTIEVLWPEIFRDIVQNPYKGMPDQLIRLAQDLRIQNIGWYPPMESKPITGYDTAPETFTHPTPLPSSASLND